LAGLPVSLFLSLFLTLLPQEWSDFASARAREAQAPAESVRIYEQLQDSREEASAAALLRLMDLDPARRTARFQLLLAKSPSMAVVEEGFRKLLDAEDARALELYPRCEKRLGAAFKKRAERVLLKIRFQVRPAERTRLIQQVFGGKSAYLRVVLGRLCMEAGCSLTPKNWLELLRSALQVRDLTLAEKCIPNLRESKPDQYNYLIGRYYFLKRDYAAAVGFFRKVKDGDEDHPYQEARCWLMLKDHGKAREAFARVGGSLLPLGRLSLVRMDLMDGDVEGALKNAKTIPAARTKLDALLACAVVLASRGDSARALKVIKDLKSDAEIVYWKARWEGTAGTDLSPRGAPFNYFHAGALKSPVAVTPVAMPAGGDPHTFPEFLLAAGLYSDVRFYLDHLRLSPEQEALVLDGAREYRREVSVIYPRASRMLAAPPEAWDMNVLSRFFPRAFERSVLKACAENGVPPEVVWSIMRQESAFHPEALSPAGAMGLMQLIPPTWADNSLPDENPWDTESNIAGGVRYLKKLYAQLGDWTYVAAAYNAGEDAVQSWLRISATADGPAFYSLIPFSETRAYVRSVLYNMLMYSTERT
jgi:hypothetical protein